MNDTNLSSLLRFSIDNYHQLKAIFINLFIFIKKGKMELTFNSIVFEHNTGLHPENALRLSAFRHLAQNEWIDGAKYLSLVHSMEHIQKIHDNSRDFYQIDDDTFLSNKSYAVACYGVGAAVQAAETGNFALIRPPGHHSYRDKASGFCLFNNVAIASEHKVREGKRVLIIDFDGHYGDGTADIFYDTDKVLYFSIHQHPAFPGTGDLHLIGEGKGKGFNMNMGVPPNSGDDIFLDAFSHFLPIFKSFNPDVVAISAGFDGAEEDPLLQLNLSPNAFYEIGKMIASSFSNTFAVLEGGYHPGALERGVYSFLAGMNGQNIPYTAEKSISGLRAWETYEMNLHSVLGFLKPFWKI
jgi:acetoin utilization deacetylase AcuC-like enzyme